MMVNAAADDDDDDDDDVNCSIQITL